MECLKTHVEEGLYNQLEVQLKGNRQVKLANLAEAAYVSKYKYLTSKANNSKLLKQLE